MLNRLKRWWPWLVLIVLPIVLMLPLIATHQLHYKVDMWFNMMRIQEMNTYWHSMTWPGLGNIHSFGQAGQLIQGMYPSFTLAILVGLTSFLSSMNQLYAILILLIILMSASFFWIFKKGLKNNTLALLSAVITTYPMVFVCAIERGQFGMVLSYIFLPLIFWGLVLIQRQDKKAPIYIGVGVGLIWLSHVSSGIFVVMLVLIMGTVDLVLGRKNFWLYVKSGIISGLVALPTLIKVLTLSGSVMGVFLRGIEADLELLDVFAPFWKGGQGYLTVISLTGLIYVIVTVYRKSSLKSLKVTVIILTLMSTSVGYLIFLRPLQFSTRFLAYALPLAMFIMLLELPIKMKNWQRDNQRIIYLLLIMMALVPAINSSLRVRNFVQTKPLWQQEGNFQRNMTKVDRASLDDPKFQANRTYIDYMPIQQKKTAEKGKLAPTSSKNMRDVNEAKSVRKTGFNSDEIKMLNPDAPKGIDNKDAAKNRVVPSNPARNIHAEKRTLTMDITVKDQGFYDLPFWMYPHIKYDVKIDDKKVTPHVSTQGRMSVNVPKGTHTVAITQVFPWAMALAYLLSGLTLIGSFVLLRRKPKYLQVKDEDNL